MKKKRFVIILLVLLCSLTLQAQTKRKKFRITKTAVTKSKTKGKVISGGVMNGKALDLVKPDYPPAAKFVCVRGAVNVAVLIDEEGHVIEAKAISGHPLLRASSISAALKSKFEPVTLGGNKVMVRGTIVYNYTLDSFNWLEIGNALKDARFMTMLPFGFDEEKLIYAQYQTADYENKILILQNLRASVENKLIDARKRLWLFQVGILLSEFQSNCCRGENLEASFQELKPHLMDAPESISPALILKLKNLLNLFENPQLDTYDPRKGSKVYQQLQDIEEKLPLLGN